MENSIRESGSTDSNMAQACGREPSQIAMSESGGWAKQKDMAYTSGSTEIGMKENSKTASNTDKEPRGSQMAISTKDSTSKANQTATVNIIGRTAATSKEISNKD